MFYSFAVSHSRFITLKRNLHLPCSSSCGVSFAVRNCSGGWGYSHIFPIQGRSTRQAIIVSSVCLCWNACKRKLMYRFCFEYCNAWSSLEKDKKLRHIFSHGVTIYIFVSQAGGSGFHWVAESPYPNSCSPPTLRATTVRFAARIEENQTGSCCYYIFIAVQYCDTYGPRASSRNNNTCLGFWDISGEAVQFGATLANNGNWKRHFFPGNNKNSTNSRN